MQGEEEAERILHDRELIVEIAAVLAEDSEKVRTTAELIKNNPALARYARLQQNDKNVSKNVVSISMSEKLRIKRAHEQAGNKRQTSGIECVCCLPNGYAKKCFLPVKEKLAELKEEMLTAEIGILFSEQPDRTNKGATSIVGKTLKGPVYFFKRCDEVTVDLTREEFDSNYPKMVIWKASGR